MTDYAEAIEKQMAWLRWSRSTHGGMLWDSLFKLNDRMGAPAPAPYEVRSEDEPTKPVGRDTVTVHQRHMYEDVLDRGDAYYVSPAFCSLIDHARQTTPGDLRFEREWLQSEWGFAYFDHPFPMPMMGAQINIAELIRKDGDERLQEQWKNKPVTPSPERLMVRAVGWKRVPDGEEVWERGQRMDGTGRVQFLCFKDEVSELIGGFWPMSMFTLRDGDMMAERVAWYENTEWDLSASEAGRIGTVDGGVHRLVPIDLSATRDSSRYVTDGAELWRHEIRLVFTMLRLMAQRVALVRQVRTPRPTRRRLERAGHPEPPEHVRLILLRRAMEREQLDEDPKEIDWQWQWDVRGHWRDQWYATEGVHKPKWIDPYTKGPTDRPFKGDQRRVFAAVR